MNKWVIILLVFLFLGLSGVSATSNPAAAYCDSLGYVYSLQHTPEGYRGSCVIQNNASGLISYDAWDFFEGKVGQQYSYCAKQGYEIESVSDGKNAFSYDYSVCIVNVSVNETISQKVDVSTLMNLSEKLSIENNSTDPTLSNITSVQESVEKPGFIRRFFDWVLRILHIKKDVSLSPLPDYFTWQNYSGVNWLTPVKDQGSCNSCTTFAAAAQIEAKIKISRNNSNFDTDLSEQYAVSYCAAPPGSGNICSIGGGFIGINLNYIASKGIVDELCFPYNFYAQCSSACSTVDQRLWKIDSWGRSLPVSGPDYTPTDEAIKTYLISKGPLSADIYMAGNFDGSGIYRCNEGTGYPPYGSGHAIVIVGYNDSGQYWIAKNSWGSGWADKGYFKVGYGECSIGHNYGIYYVEMNSTVKSLKYIDAIQILTGTSNGVPLDAASVDGSYLSLKESCSGGNCNGLNSILAFNISSLINPSYIDLIANIRGNNDPGFSLKYLNPLQGISGDFGSVPQSSQNWTLIKYRLCNSTSSCSSLIASKIVNTSLFHSICTNCGIDQVDLDGFYLESDALGGVSPLGCGNGLINPGEVCDGNNFNGKTCSNLLGSGWSGSLTCLSCNSVNVSSCTGSNAIVGRNIFYLNSSFDNGNHDNAVATDKFALLLGQPASSASYTSYTKGINGIMIDITGYTPNLTLSDFTFKMGNDDFSDGWGNAPNPILVLRPGAGVFGSNRIELIWPDGLISGKWIQVTLKKGPATKSGLSKNDVFYFGNAIGETGNSPSDAIVDINDQNLVSSNFANNADIMNSYDFNKDGKVDNIDQAISVNYSTDSSNALRLLQFSGGLGISGTGGIPISSCTVINSNGVYNLTQDIYSVSTCIIINANNVVFDGQGHNIVLSGYPGNKVGIVLNGVSNTVIKNVNIKNFIMGISHNPTSNDWRQFSNNTYNNITLINDSTGINLGPSQKNFLYNIFASNNGYGLYTNLAHYTSFVNITAVSNVQGISAQADGMQFTNITSSFNKYTGLFIQGYDSSLNYLTLKNNENGLFLSSNGGHTIQNLIASGNAQNGIIDHTDNSLFVNITTFSNNVSGVDISGKGNRFMNLNSYDNKGWQMYDFYKDSYPSIAYSNQFGQISFLDVADSYIGTNNITFPGNIILSNNLVGINSDLYEFNRAANVTLYGISTSYSNPIILRNGVLCQDCLNFTSLNAGTVMFRINSAGNYSISSS